MMMLVPIKSGHAQLISVSGTERDPIIFPWSANQLLIYPVVLDGQTPSSVQLATGEFLSSMDGQVQLIRGVQYIDSTKERIPDHIEYIPARNGYSGDPPSQSAYIVYLHIDECLFDQVVTLSQACGLPSILMRFDYKHSRIAYATNDSEFIWNNSEETAENVESFRLMHTFPSSI